MAKAQVKMTVNGREVEALVEPRTLLIHGERTGRRRPRRFHAVL